MYKIIKSIIILQNANILVVKCKIDDVDVDSYMSIVLIDTI